MGGRLLTSVTQDGMNPGATPSVFPHSPTTAPLIVQFVPRTICREVYAFDYNGMTAVIVTTCRMLYPRSACRRETTAAQCCTLSDMQRRMTL